jgi:hypothetical protein
MAASAAADALAIADGVLDRSKISGILDVCDRVAGETSKRGHVLDAPTGQLVTVDAYYPRNQVVVLCQDRPDPYSGLTAQSAAKHGLRLLEIDLREFRDDAGQAFSRLIRELRLLTAATPRDPVPTEVQPSPVAPPPVAPPPVAPPPTFTSAPEPPPPPPPRFAPPGPIPEPPPWPPLANLYPNARPPAPAAPRQSVSSALQAAVHRFTAAPEPFVLGREAAPPTAPTLPIAPTPHTAPLPPAAATPRPPAAATPPRNAAAPPPAPAAAAPPLPPVSSALQRYLTAAAPAAPAAPPPPPPLPPPPATATTQPFIPSPLPFNPSPLPFERVAPMTDPVLAHLASLARRPEPDRNRPRVGQRQAEAAARAARFVEARGARNSVRYPAPGAMASRSASPALSRNSAGTNPWAQAPASAPPTHARAFAPPAQARAFAPPALATPPTAFVATLPAFDPPAGQRSNSRAERIERAIAHGRTTPEPRPRTAADSRARTPQGARASTTPSPAAAPERRAAKPIASEDVLALGLVVGSIVVLELVLGVILAVGGGPVVLGLGLVLDAAARAVGTLAAVHSGEEWGSGWPWACGLIGSPAVAAFAFNGDGSLAAVEFAALAGPLSAVAIVTVVIGLAGIPFGV